MRKIAERICSRTNCSPSIILVILGLMVLGLFVAQSHTAITTAAWTALVLGVCTSAMGLFLLVRTVYGWHHSAERTPEEHAPEEPTPEESMIAEADTLAKDNVVVMLNITPEGKIAGS